MRIIKKIALVTVISGLMTACSQNENTIARVDNKKITQEAFDAYLDFKQADSSNAKQTQGHLNQYLNSEALALAIEKTNILNADKSAAALNELKKEMLTSRYFEKFLNEQVTDETIRDYHVSSANKLESTKAQVAHILISTHKNMSSIERKAKYDSAYEAYSKLKAGAGFAQMVTEYSDDMLSAEKAGEIGLIDEGAINPQFSKTVFKKLKAGEVSRPVQSNFGFHIIKLLAEPVAVKKPLEKVKDVLRLQLQETLREAEIKRLTGTVKVTRS